MSDLKEQYPKTGIGYLCELFGYSRQAWYKSMHSRDIKCAIDNILLGAINEIRESQGRLGTVKLKIRLKNVYGLEVGRDYLYNLLRDNGLLVKRRKKRRPDMTDGNGRSRYPDLRKEMKPDGKNQLWSSDITYVELNNCFCYATFIIDEWSHKIVGFNVSRKMTALEVSKALKNAIKSEGPEFGGRLVHHSDRGSQYKSNEYLNLLKKHGIIPSMTENGSPYENPISERLNGIIKNELLGGKKFNCFRKAASSIAAAVKIYNEERPHFSCGLMTPQEAHKSTGPLRKLWRKKNRKSNSKAV